MEPATSAEPPRPDALPIEACLPELSAACRAGATLLLQAPPGAGKTSRVPPALLARLAAGQRLVVLQPRRLAAIAAAERLAALLGDSVGGLVGYRVRLASRCSAATRIEVQTVGLFLRQLQDDPGLEGIGLVIFDEFHERHADADLALALLRQARQLLRPDLILLLMSATLALDPLTLHLPAAQVITSAGRSFPVAVVHQPPRPDEPLPRQLLRALERHWLDRHDPAETALVFLPGQREIQACQRAIAACPWAAELELVPLHGQLPLSQQSRAIAAAQRPAGRIVLATSIAESSLTIQGVTLVIDAGLARRSRFDPRSGMDALVTLPASQASAEQRRGRAGRLAPGRCIRLWSEADQQRRAAFDTPEILEADPLPLALQLAAWGSPCGDDLAWIDAPAAAPLSEARQLLHQLGACDSDGRISRHGRAMARLGVHPRLAHLLLAADRRQLLPLGCALAVLLSERDPLERAVVGCDLLPRLDALRRGQGDCRQLQRLQRQLQAQVRAGRTAASGGAQPEAMPPDTAPDPGQVARLLALAYPERVALSRGQRDGRFLMRGGRGASLPPGDPLAGASALAIASVDGQGAEARVLLAAALPEELLQELAAVEAEERLDARWDPTGQRVRCERSLRLGALVLERRPWPEAEPLAVRGAMVTGLRQLGLDALPWTPESRQLRHRLELAQRHLGAPWPDRRREILQADPQAWLAPQLDGCRSRQDLQKLDLETALWGDLAWCMRAELERLLPTTLAVPSGRRVSVRYGDGSPVLAVKLQEMFGCRDTPSLLDGRLPLTLELLSPAGRPAALTQDLAGFWSSGYAEVRRELRGRYPRHPWPQDPLQATPTALSKASLARRSAAAPS